MNTEVDKGISRLVLGTAQLGMPYGIANRTGQPDFAMAVSIIKAAWDGGIREFDTAQAYGESETVLGRALLSLGISNDVRIITKLDPKLEPHQEQQIRRAVDRSLERLQISRLYGIMLHREGWLHNLHQGLEKTLQTLVLDGAVQQVGVSLYTPAMARRALESDILAMLQVPANLADRRFADAGVLALANDRGKQVYIRSVFLQGLLLMRPEDLPAKLGLAKTMINNLETLCMKYNYTRQEMALRYIKAKYPQAKIVIGAETVPQLEQNLTIWQDDFRSTSCIREIDDWPITDERIINPALWS